MATAVQTVSGKDAATGDRLLPASLLGAVFLLVGLAAVGWGVPTLLAKAMPGGGFAMTFFRVVIQLAAIAGLFYLGSRLAGANPPRGLRGGICVVICTFLIVFLLWRMIGLTLTTDIGKGIAIALILVLLYFAWKFLAGDRARRWMLGLEEMGLFHTFSYKRTQGLKMRRYTIIGILLVGLSGVWTLMNSGILGSGDLRIRIPFLSDPVAILADKNFSIPLLLTALILWFAWRIVNIPTFADFLIATEAEMNKVSWTPRKRLFQDTVVVLVTTLLLTVFLLVIDLFWGWLLSLSFIGVLPSKEYIDSLKTTEPATKQADW